jgi:hypothetical protein
MFKRKQLESLLSAQQLEDLESERDEEIALNLLRRIEDRYADRASMQQLVALYWNNRDLELAEEAE